MTVKVFDASMMGLNTLKKKNRAPGHLCGSTALRGKKWNRQFHLQQLKPFKWQAKTNKYCQMHVTLP